MGINEQSKIKCAIFDVDGTLLDSMAMWESLASDYAAMKKISLPEDAMAQMNAKSMAQCAEFYRKCGAEGTAEKILEEIIDVARQKYRESIQAVPGAMEFVKSLKESGVYVALATASHVGALTPALEREGIMQYVDFALSCEDVGASKEHPDIFLRCAEEFRCKPCECVVFEDALYSAKTAKNAGFRLIGIDDKCHSTVDRDELKKISEKYVLNYKGLSLDSDCKEFTVNVV